MRIELATPADLSEIRAVYAHGREMQRAAHSIVWPEFTDATILAEVEAGNLFRIVTDAGLAGIFSVAYEDGLIWGALERGAHIYLHRIARAPGVAGGGLVDAVLDWAEARCARLEREGLRLDTWANNTALIAFYERRGFRLIAERTLGADPNLAAHYHGNTFALLEKSCSASDTASDTASGANR